MEKKCIAGIIVVLVVVIAAFGAYLLLTDDSKADNDTYYFYIEAEDGAELPELSDGWFKATGENAMVALQNACNENNWQIVVNGDYLSELFGLGMVQDEVTLDWSYWVTYRWDDSMDAFKFSNDFIGDIVADGAPQYISLSHKVYNEATDVPPTASINDIPKGL